MIPIWLIYGSTLHPPPPSPWKMPAGKRQKRKRKTAITRAVIMNSKRNSCVISVCWSCDRQWITHCERIVWGVTCPVRCKFGVLKILLPKLTYLTGSEIGYTFWESGLRMFWSGSLDLLRSESCCKELTFRDGILLIVLHLSQRLWHPRGTKIGCFPLVFRLALQDPLLASPLGHRF